MTLNLTQLAQIERAQAEADHYDVMAARKAVRDRSPLPALYRGVGPGGRPLVERLGHAAVEAGASLTSGAVRLGGAVALSAGRQFADQMPAPRYEVPPLQKRQKSLPKGDVAVMFSDIFYAFASDPDYPPVVGLARFHLWVGGLFPKPVKIPDDFEARSVWPGARNIFRYFLTTLSNGEALAEIFEVLQVGGVNVEIERHAYLVSASGARRTDSEGWRSPILNLAAWHFGVSSTPDYPGFDSCQVELALALSSQWNLRGRSARRFPGVRAEGDTVTRKEVFSEGIEDALIERYSIGEDFWPAACQLDPLDPIEGKILSLGIPNWADVIVGEGFEPFTQPRYTLRAWCPSPGG